MNRVISYLLPLVRRLFLLLCVVGICGLMLWPGGTGYNSALAAAAAATPTGSTTADEPKKIEIVFFWGDGCPHCAQEKPFLNMLVNRYPNRITLKSFELWYHPENHTIYKNVTKAYGLDIDLVPVTFIGNKYWVGFNDQIRQEITEAVADCLEGEIVCPNPSDIAAGVIAKVGAGGMGGADSPLTKEAPTLGSIDLSNKPLILSTALIAFVDGLNPCSLWVLSMLLAIVVHSGSRRRTLLVGLVFLVTSALVYGLFMTGLFSVLSYVAYLRWIQIVVAFLALVFGLINIKDYFWFRTGPSLTISDQQKPTIYSRMRAILHEPRAPAMVGATAVLAAGVSLVELPCTAGFPVLWTSLIASRQPPLAVFYLLLALYLLIFLIDELVLFLAAVITMRVAKMQEKHGRILKLVGGTVMLALAAAMIIRPELLNTFQGAALLFLLAVLGIFLLAGIRHLTQRRVLAGRS